MTKPKLLGRTPNNSDVNTLHGDYDDIIADPARRRYAVVEYGVVDVNHPVHGGDDVPRLEIVHWETMSGHLEDQVTKLLDEAFTGRTGQAKRPNPSEVGDSPLPLDEFDEAAPK